MLAVRTWSPSTIKAVALVLLCLQNTCLITTTRYSRSVLGDTYLSSTVVVMMELCKLVTCVFLMMRDSSGSIDILHLIKTSAVMAVPGLAYVIQNSLQLIALTVYTLSTEHIYPDTHIHLHTPNTYTCTIHK